MKIIDRYVLTTFIKNYLITLMVLVGMYVALDMVFNFANLTQSPKQSEGALSFFHILYDIGDFYFYQCFVFFVHLSGIIAVVAAAFTLMRLSRFNEMTALLAAGTPLLRVSMSIVVAGVVLNLLLLPIDEEIIIPQMIPKLIREHSEVHQASVKTFPVRMMQDENGGLFNAAMYSPAGATARPHIKYLDVIERNEKLEPTSHLFATQAEWNGAEKRWDLTDGWRVPIDTGERAHPPDDAVAVASYKSDITPEEIALNLGKDYIQLLPTSKLNQLIAKPKSYGTINLLRTKHLRFTQPLVNVILLLLAIPSVLTREPNTLKTAAARCMLLTTLCMGSVFLAFQVAGSPPAGQWMNTWPAIMAWLPIFVFGPLAVYLLDHVKS